MPTNRFGYKNLGYGLGLRSPHYDTIIENRPRNVDFFEIISENFIEAHNGYWEFLDDLRADYPILMHGVSMSIGSTDPLNFEYLHKLKNLADFLEVPWLSDHLCWTGVSGKNSHDLLPVPYSEEALKHIIERVGRVQDFLGRKIVLENPSTYLEFYDSTIPEWEFFATVANESDCGILLDINNVYVNAFNHGYDAVKYIDSIPKDRVVQIHLAGHRSFDTHIIDTHDSFVSEQVWQLYSYAIKRFGEISTMIEWDENIPEFDVLVLELDKAKEVAGKI